MEVLEKEKHQEDKEIGTLTQGHGNLFGRFSQAKERQIWRGKFGKIRSVREGREEQRVRVEFWERGVGERKTKMIEEEYQRNKVMCIPLP